MKKIIIAFIAGALVMVSGQALADTVSQIGKKVDSEATVYVDGKKVSDAIIIKGKSYVPGRDVAEALGGTVEWKGSENSIVITSDSNSIAETQSNEVIESNEVLRLKEKIKSTEQKISDYNSLIDTMLMQQQSSEDKAYYDHHISQLNDKISVAEEELSQYEKELAELESTK